MAKYFYILFAFILLACDSDLQNPTDNNNKDPEKINLEIYPKEDIHKKVGEEIKFEAEIDVENAMIFVADPILGKTILMEELHYSIEVPKEAEEEYLYKFWASADGDYSDTLVRKVIIDKIVEPETELRIDDFTHSKIEIHPGEKFEMRFKLYDGEEPSPETKVYIKNSERIDSSNYTFQNGVAEIELHSEFFTPGENFIKVYCKKENRYSDTVSFSVFLLDECQLIIDQMNPSEDLIINSDDEFPTFSFVVKNNYGDFVKEAKIQFTIDDHEKLHFACYTNAYGEGTFKVPDELKELIEFTLHFKASKENCESSEIRSIKIKIKESDIKKLKFYSITPIEKVTLSPFEKQQYNLKVVDHNNQPVKDAVIYIYDELIDMNSSLKTNAEGRAEYVTEVPNGAENKIYEIVFQAEKDGYLSTDEQVRRVLVSNDCKLVISELAPEATQYKKAGEQVIFELQVDNNKGNPMSNSTVIISNNLLGKVEQVSTNAYGRAVYKFICPENKKGKFEIIFSAEHHECSKSDMKSRKVVVE